MATGTRQNTTIHISIAIEAVMQQLQAKRDNSLASIDELCKVVQEQGEE